VKGLGLLLLTFLAVLTREQPASIVEIRTAISTPLRGYRRRPAASSIARTHLSDIAPHAHIGSGAAIGAGAKIGVRTYVGAGARVAVGSLIGDDETIGDSERVATDRRGLRLAA